MFETRNSHLNLFRGWRQQEVAGPGLPLDRQIEELTLENNLTRALAITLEREHLFAARFAQMVDELREQQGMQLGALALRYPCEVAIEVRDEDLLDGIVGCEQLLAVIITSSTVATSKASPVGPDNGFRVDLVLRFGSSVLLGEAKRHSDAVSAEAQMRGYLQKLNRVDVKPVHLSWQAILHEARAMVGSDEGRPPRVLADFVEFLSISARRLGWEGLELPLDRLLTTPIQARDALWRSDLDSAIATWVGGIQPGVPQASVEEHILRKRYCIRVDWMWAREINFRMVPDLNFPAVTVEREYALDETVRSIAAMDGYLTIGDALGQIRRFPNCNPWDIVLPEGWRRIGALGLMHINGRAVEFVDLDEAASRFLWNNRHLLARYERDAGVPGPACPLPDEPLWQACRCAWERYWAGGRNFVVLTARVQYHRTFPLTPAALPDTNMVAADFAELRALIAAGPQEHIR